ncbi:MAG: hypothetical protein Q8M56_07930 [Desulfobacterales bacterium]|jgi:hypothetical protein|nr:hypothetical protein [Desulfobacterales bacterium]
MKHIWQLREAKNKFSEVVEGVLSEFFRQSPLAGIDLDLKRNMDAVRSDIDR